MQILQYTTQTWDNAASLSIHIHTQVFFYGGISPSQVFTQFLKDLQANRMGPWAP